MLGLAQEIADRLTREAKAESDAMLSKAGTTSEQLLSQARAKADGMVLSVVDLADDGVIEVAGDRGVRMPRPLVAGGALVGSVTVCSAW